MRNPLPARIATRRESKRNPYPRKRNLFQKNRNLAAVLRNRLFDPGQRPEELIKEFDEGRRRLLLFSVCARTGQTGELPRGLDLPIAQKIATQMVQDGERVRGLLAGSGEPVGAKRAAKEE